MGWIQSMSKPEQLSPVEPVKEVPVIPVPVNETKDPSKPMAVLKGGDFSHFEPTVAWKEYVGAGYAFAFTKCADGLGSKDSAFDKIREGAHNAGVPFAGYFFFRFADKSPVDQAKLFYNSWTGGIQKGEMNVPACDFEWDNHSSAKGRYGDGKETDTAGNNLFITFLTEVEQLFGATPLIYTGRSFMPMKDPRFSRFPLWVFDYHNNPPRLPPSWTDYTFHQFTDKNKFPGATGTADCSYYNGDLASLQTMVKK